MGHYSEKTFHVAPHGALSSWAYVQITNIAETSRNAGQHQEECCRHLIGTFACWKMWITLWMRSAFVLQRDRGKIRHQAQLKWVVSLMIADALSL